MDNGKGTQHQRVLDEDAVVQRPAGSLVDTSEAFGGRSNPAGGAGSGLLDVTIAANGPARTIVQAAHATSRTAPFGVAQGGVGEHRTEANDQRGAFAMDVSFWTSTLPLVSTAAVVTSHRTSSALDRTIGHNVGAVVTASPTAVPARPAPRIGTRAYLHASRGHALEHAAVVGAVAAFLPSVDLALSLCCLNGVCNDAAIATLRSRVVDREDVEQSPSVVRLTLQDGVRVTYARDARTCFFEVASESAKRNHASLVWGIMTGALARELITLPHMRRSDKSLFNFFASHDDETALIGAAQRGAAHGAEDYAAAAANGAGRRMAHEKSHITSLTGWWFPLAPARVSLQNTISQATFAPPPLARRPSELRTREGREAAGRAASTTLKQVRAHFPYLYDVKATLLRCPVQLTVTHVVRSVQDVSHLLRLPTEPSPSMLRRATSIPLSCRVIATDAESGMHVASWDYDLVPLFVPPNERSVSPTSSTAMVAIRGYLAVPYLHLARPVMATQHLASRVPRPAMQTPTGGAVPKAKLHPTQSAMAPLVAPCVPKHVTLQVFLDGMPQPIGVLGNVSLSMTLAELRTCLKATLKSASSVIDSSVIKTFRNNGGSTRNQPSPPPQCLIPQSITPRSTNSGGGPQHPTQGGLGGGAVSRRSSARSQIQQRFGSTATLSAQLGGGHAFADVNEDAVLVVDALPPVRGQYLQRMLEGYERSVCGWLGSDVTILQDCALCIIIAPKPTWGPTLPIGSTASLLNNTTAASSNAPPHDLQSTAAARVRHLRAQKAKDALKETHPALQSYFLAQGAAIDASRRGDVPALQALLDATGSMHTTGTGLSATTSPAAGSAPSIFAAASKVMHSSRLPPDLPPLMPHDHLNGILVHTAAENGRQPILSLLIGRGFPVDRRDADGQFPLHRCAAKGHAECIPTLLRAPRGGVALNAFDARGRTPLHLALEARLVNTALWLVEQGANPDLRNAAGKSAADAACVQLVDLHTLCRAGDVDGIRALLEGAQPITPSILSSDAAAAAWYSEALKHRLTRGRLLFGLRNHFSIHTRTGAAVPNVTGVSALHEAVLSGHAHVVRLLLHDTFRSMVDMSEETSSGDSILHLAARSKNRQMFALVLDAMELVVDDLTTTVLSTRAGGACDVDEAASDNEGSAGVDAASAVVAALCRTNAAGDTPLHVALKAAPSVCASVLVHVLTRCQVAPAKYPLPSVGYLVSKVQDAQGLTVCHCAVRRAALLPDGVLQALLAAALSAAPSLPAVCSAAATQLLASTPRKSIAEHFRERFPHRAALPSRLLVGRGIVPPASLMLMGVTGGVTSVVTLLVDFMKHCVQQNITWPLSDFGALSSPGLLNAAYLRNDADMFHLLLNCQAQPAWSSSEGLHPFMKLDLSTTQYRPAETNDGTDVECVEVPVAWRLLSDARSTMWVDTVVESPLLLSSLRRADKVMYDFNCINSTEAGVSTLSLLVDEAVTAAEERERRRLPSRAPPPPPVHTTWGQFLVKPRDPTREELAAQLGVEQRRSDHRLYHAEREGTLLYALRQLLMAFHPSTVSQPSATERHLYSRRVLYAAIRCRGHAGAFEILSTMFDGTHIFSHEDLVRFTNLGVQYGLTPSAGVAFQELRPDGRMFTPGVSLKPTRSGGGDTAPGSRGGLNTRGSLLSRGSGRSQRGDAAVGQVVETSMGCIFGDPEHTHAFERRMRDREAQLCQLIPFIAVLAPGAFLHDLVSRRMFGAAMTLLVTATANAHTACGGDQHLSTARSRSRSPSPHTLSFRGPLSLRNDNVDLRCPELEALSGVTALHIAAQFGVTQLVHGLLRTGQFHSRLVSEARYWTPMHWAARYGHVDTCRTLLGIGVPPTDVSDPTGSGSVLGTTPLHLAAVCGSVELVKLLLDHYAAVDARSLMGRTPLHLAARKGHVDVALALLDAGAKIDREDEDGYTPILLAGQEGHGHLITRVVTFLRREKLLLTVNPRNGVCLAHFAAWIGGEEMTLLLQRVLQQSASVPAAARTVVSPVSTAIGAAPGAVDGHSPPQAPIPALQVPALRETTVDHMAAGASGTATSAWLDSNTSFVAKAAPDASHEMRNGTGHASALQTILSSSGRAPHLERACGQSSYGLTATWVPSSRPSTAGAAGIEGTMPSASSYGLQSKAKRVGVATLLASSTRGAANGTTGVALRTTPPSDAQVHVIAPVGGSLQVLQALLDATESRRVAMLDNELHRYVQLGVNVAKLDGCIDLQLPDSFTVVRQSATMDVQPIGLQADRRGDHCWVPLHYAVANGCKDAARLLRDAVPASQTTPQMPDVMLDREAERSAREQNVVLRQRRRSEALAKTVFPEVVSTHTFPALIAASANSVKHEVFEPLPPAPPSPRLWHAGYYGRGTAGMTGCIANLSSSSTRISQRAGGKSVFPVDRTFAELSRRRVMRTMAWMVSRSLCGELFKYLPLLSSVDEPVDDSGVTLLMVAAFHNRVEVVDILMDHGANVNACVVLRRRAECSTATHLAAGLTPLLIASAAGCLSMVDKLIEHHANPDVADECGNTPVHHAVLKQDFKMVKALLHAGAQISVLNHAGDTPEDIAVALRHHSITRMLRWWSMTFRIEPSDRTAHRDACHTELEYAAWISKASAFYKRLDLLHDQGHLLMNKVERDSVPALMYIRLCQRLKVTPAVSMISILVPYWWPEDVHAVRLEGVFLDDASLAAIFTFLKLLTHLEDFGLSDGKLTDAMIPSLYTACVEHPHLRRLHLAANRGIGRSGAMQLLDLVQQNTNIVGVDLAATSVDVPIIALIQRHVDANKKQQALDVEDPSRPPMPTITHKPYHLPRISAADSPQNTSAAHN